MNSIDDQKKNIDKMKFHISETSPIALLHHQWPMTRPPHHDMHFGLELGILLSGKMQRFNRESKKNLKPGDVWLCGMWEPHGYAITKANTQAIVLIIYPPALARTQLDQAHPIRWLAPFEASSENRPQTNKKNRPKMLELGLELQKISSISSHHRNAWLKIKLYETLLVLLENWKSPSDTTPQTTDELAIVNKAIKLVFENTAGITTQQAAAACSMNRNSFAKLFSSIMGLRFQEFDLRFRTTQAASLLQNSNITIKKIANDCGFADVSHLYRNFVKFYNQTPKEFRNAAKSS